MALDSEVPDHYYTFEGRLASFKAAQPVNRRRSTATKAKGPKSLSWPHKRLDAAAVRVSAARRNHADTADDAC